MRMVIHTVNFENKGLVDTSVEANIVVSIPPGNINNAYVSNGNLTETTTGSYTYTTTLPASGTSVVTFECSAYDTTIDVTVNTVPEDNISKEDILHGEYVAPIPTFI